MHRAATWGKTDSIRVLAEMKGDVEARNVSRAGAFSMAKSTNESFFIHFTASYVWNGTMCIGPGSISVGRMVGWQAPCVCKQTWRNRRAGRVTDPGRGLTVVSGCQGLANEGLQSELITNDKWR
jgi:hypothetical protein